MAIYIKEEGSWVQIQTPYVKIGSAWKEASRILTNVDGIWRLVWPSQGWFALAEMPTGRLLYGIAEVDGIIYVAGGQTQENDAVKSHEAYDIKSNTWTVKEPIPKEAQGNSAEAINGIIYHMGGATSLHHKYYPATNTWDESIQSLPYYQDDGIATTVRSSYIHSIGGMRRLNPYKKHAIYDPATNTWTIKADLPENKFYASAVTLGNLVYLIGGITTLEVGYTQTVYAYDPSSNSWATKASILNNLDGFASEVMDGKIYSCGSWLEEYDPALNTWVYKENPVVFRGRNVGTRSVCYDGGMYFIGGHDTLNNVPYSARNEVYFL